MERWKLEVSDEKVMNTYCETSLCVVIHVVWWDNRPPKRLLSVFSLQTPVLYNQCSMPYRKLRGNFILLRSLASSVNFSAARSKKLRRLSNIARTFSCASRARRLFQQSRVHFGEPTMSHAFRIARPGSYSGWGLRDRLVEHVLVDRNILWRLRQNVVTMEEIEIHRPECGRCRRWRYGRSSLILHLLQLLLLTDGSQYGADRYLGQGWNLGRWSLQTWAFMEDTKHF